MWLTEVIFSCYQERSVLVAKEQSMNVEKNKPSPLAIKLNELELAEIQSFLQEGARGMSDFAASCNSTNSCGSGSCSSKSAASL